MTTDSSSDAAFFQGLRSWNIPRSNERVFGGVLGGVGARIGMAPAPARILFVLLAILTGGIALLAYATAWALLPDAEGRIVIQDFGRGRPNVGAIISIVVMTILGFAALRFGVLHAVSQFASGQRYRDIGFSDHWISRPFHLVVGFFIMLLVLAVIGGVVALIVWSVRSSTAINPPAGGYATMPDGTVPSASNPAAASGDGEAGEGESGDSADADAAADAAAATTAVDVDGASPVHMDATPAAVAVAAALPPQTPPLYAAPPRLPKQRKPRVPGPGKVGYLLALAWIPLSIALTVYMTVQNQLAVWPGVVLGLVYVAGLGLILVINALRGRKAGFLGFLSIVALIPTVLIVANADTIREHYQDGTWDTWINGQIAAEPMPEETYIAPPPFDPTATFPDYATVAIAGQCVVNHDLGNPDANGTVSLAAVSGPTTLTISTDVTRVVVPRGTSLKIVAPTDTDGGYEPYVGVTWVDRDLTCSMDSSSGTVVALSTPETPVLTLELSDTHQNGQFDIYIEETS